MKMRSKMQNEKGFTLVELMVVVVILGILVAIAVPVYNSTQEKAKINAHNANVRTLESAATMYIVENADDPALDTDDSQAALEGKFIQKWPDNPMADGDDYTLEIDEDGIITVLPDKVEQP